MNIIIGIEFPKKWYRCYLKSISIRIDEKYFLEPDLFSMNVGGCEKLRPQIMRFDQEETQWSWQTNIYFHIT